MFQTTKSLLLSALNDKGGGILSRVASIKCVTNLGSNTSGIGNNTTGSTGKSTYDEDNVPPTIREFDFADKVKGLLYVKDGNMVTTFTSCQSEDSLLPIKIKHIHKFVFGESSYGLNWRLNVNKTLKAAFDDNVKTTKYLTTLWARLIVICIFKSKISI